MPLYDAQVFRVEVFALGCAGAATVGLLGGVNVGLAAAGRRRLSPRRLRAAAGAAALLLGLCLCAVDATLIEPDWLSETHIEVPTRHLPPGGRLRIVQLTDLHVGHMTRALAELPERVNALQPDLLIYTGDSLNPPGDLADFRRVVSSLHARYGRFAVKGNHDVWYWPHSDLFGGGVATELVGPPVEAAEGQVTLCGAPYGHPERLTACLSVHPDGLRIVAYHTPDEVEDLARLEPDLYLAGHTHGGQVRLPFYGALATASKFDKRYEMGRYQVGATTLFVSRGVGFEPPPAPRIRFLCRPEIAVIDLVGAPQ